MSIKIKIISSKQDLEVAFSIRHAVFVMEQNVPENIEWDKFEKTSTHILACFNEKPIGTARWRETDKGFKLERFAVLENYRSLGVGTALVRFVLKEFKGKNNIYLHAQEHVIGFYKKLHFVGVGDIFYEAGIAHLKMVYNPK